MSIEKSYNLVCYDLSPMENHLARGIRPGKFVVELRLEETDAFERMQEKAERIFDQFNGVLGFATMDPVVAGNDEARYSANGKRMIRCTFSCVPKETIRESLNVYREVLAVFKKTCDESKKAMFDLPKNSFDDQSVPQVEDKASLLIALRKLYSTSSIGNLLTKSTSS